MSQPIPPSPATSGPVRLALIDADTTLRADEGLKPEGRELLAALDRARVPYALCSAGPAEDLTPLADEFPQLSYLVADRGDTVLRRGPSEWQSLDGGDKPTSLEPVGPDAIVLPPEDHARFADDDTEPGPECRGGSRVVDHLGLRWRDVLAIGDNTADLAMLGLAGLAVCLAPLSGADLAPAMEGQQRISCATLGEALVVLRSMEPSPLG